MKAKLDDVLNPALQTLVLEEVCDEETHLMSRLPEGAKPRVKPGYHVWQKEDDGDLFDHGRPFVFLILKATPLPCAL